MSNSQPRVAILHGLAEGPRISRRLRNALSTRGFLIADSPEQADVLIVHSGGYHLIPSNVKNKTILLLGPSNGYKGRSLFVTQLHKLLLDARYCFSHRHYAWWAYKSFWNAAYLLIAHGNHVQMLRGSRHLGKTLPHLDARRLAIVLYKEDPWSWHMPQNNLGENTGACLISHPGVHDDLWLHPDEYATVLQYLYET